MAKNTTERICAVCGDLACGNNYSVMSCVSCKTFFQRNGLRKKEFKCKFNNNCDINCLTRKWCQKCRFDKCLAVGMKKEYLMSAEERKLRMIKLNKKRSKQASIQLIKQECDSTADVKPDIDSIDLLLFDTNEEKDIFDEIFADNSISEEDIKNEIIKIETNVETNGINQNLELIHKNESDIQNTVQPIYRPITDYMNTFNEYEGNKLTELLYATNHLQRNTCYEFNHIYEPTDYFTACALWAPQIEIDLVDIVKMSKKLSLFNEICENDKIYLLKYGGLGITGLRCIKDFNREHQTWHVYKDNDYMAVIRFDIIKELQERAYDLNVLIIQTFLPEWYSDQIIIELLSAIHLFNPNRPKLLYRQIVKYQQYVYMYLLKRYLLLKYRSESESNAIFNKKLKYKPILGPLLREIYDIE